jgi:hypothetical protein
MHIPTIATTSQSPRELIALIGAPGSGKTTAALTFPNPYVFDFDHKLPKDIQNSPLWDPDFCDKLAKRSYAHWPSNRRDAFKKHLREEHAKFTPDQTLILDSWTLMQNAFDQQTQLEEDMCDKPNPFSFWKRKAQYSIEIMEMLKACKCKVVVTFHEAIDRDPEGEPTGKLRPVMDGSFKDQLLGHFTDVWRQVCDPPELDEATGKPILKDGKRQYKKGYYFRLLADPQVNTNTNPTLGAIIRARKISLVKSDYQSIKEIYAN